jgi:hypothetical protein
MTEILLGKRRKMKQTNKIKQLHVFTRKSVLQP